jgi:hypothetical protein
LGIDNPGPEKDERLLVDEVNAGNQEINSSQDGFEDSLDEWIKGIKETLGFDISIKPNTTYVNSIHNDVHGQGQEVKPDKKDQEAK